MNIQNFDFNDLNKARKQRMYKGKSIIGFPDSYIVIDIETTGLSPEYNDIIEIAGIKYNGEQIVDNFSSLIQPPKQDGIYVDSYIESLTGITNSMLATAPSASDILPKFYEFLGDSILVGHNVNFDINFLYDNFERIDGRFLRNNYIDTMRISRKLHPEDNHHKLRDLVKKYNIKQNEAHRAYSDCITTTSIFRALQNEICDIYGSLENYLDSIKESYRKRNLDVSSITTDNIDFDTSHPLYDTLCVFTGTLERMIRKDAMQIVVDLGGKVANSVNKQTNYLILGNNDYCKTLKEGKSAKQKKAEKLKLEGYDIEIIPENVFYDMIEIDADDYPYDASQFDEKLNINKDEGKIATHYITLLESEVPSSLITIERRSDNYLTLCTNGIDFLRFKYTSRAKWIALDAWEIEINKDDLRFIAQKNKNQRFWKATIADLSDLAVFDDLVIEIVRNIMNKGF